MLTRFDPFREFDALVEQLTPKHSQTSGMPLDIARGKDGYVVVADLPGIDPESIDLSVEGNVLTIRASRPAGRYDDMQVLATERPSGNFMRQLTVGDGFDLDGVTADYEAGVLTVTLPVAESARPRKISVNTSRKSDAIDATST